MTVCPRCQYEIPDELVFERAAALGWLHPEEIDAALETKVDELLSGLKIRLLYESIKRKKWRGGIGGFSFIELLIFILIFATLAAVAIPTFLKILGK